MWFSIVAWIVLVGASAFFAGAALNLSPAEVSSHFAALPGPQRFALGAILFTTLALIGSSVWQAFSLAHQNKRLRDRLKGLRQDTLTAHETQTQFDTGVQHLVDSDPQEAIASIEKALTETEQRAVLAHGQSESVDMRDRLDEIRRRQKVLRETIGVVAEKRRVIEPVFGELKDRQRQLERWLTDLETDDSKNNIADRLKDLTHNVAVIHERKTLLQEFADDAEPFQGRTGKVRDRAGAAGRPRHPDRRPARASRQADRIARSTRNQRRGKARAHASRRSPGRRSRSSSGLRGWTTASTS